MENEVKFRDDKITHETLKSNNYDKMDSGSNNVKTTWFKVIKDDYGKKYVIMFNEFDWSVYSNHYFKDTSFEPVVQFSLDNENAVNVSYLAVGETIEQIESFYENMWKTMQFSYFEIY